MLATTGTKVTITQDLFQYYSRDMRPWQVTIVISEMCMLEIITSLGN